MKFTTTINKISTINNINNIQLITVPPSNTAARKLKWLTNINLKISSTTARKSTATPCR